MNIISLIFSNQKKAFSIMLLLTFISSILGILVLAFINQKLLQNIASSEVMLQFSILLIIYFASATFAQIKLSKLGHQFVYKLRIELLKQIMDSHLLQIQQTGKPKILASLSNDIRSMSMAFARMPEFIQGVLFIIVCSIYLIHLSLSLFLVTALILIIMTLGSNIVVKRVYENFAKARSAEDELYKHYQTSLDGHKELKLNRYRAQRFYDEEFIPAANNNKIAFIKADTLHSLAINWGNTLMLAAVGIIFYLAIYKNWASFNDATTITMIILFMRAPLAQVIGAFPMILSSQVSLNALKELGLEKYKPEFLENQKMPENWQTIKFENISYKYPEQGGQKFNLNPINLTLKRRESVFLIGENGSGKSTLSMLLAGLYEPHEGKIYIDDIEINENNRSAYRQIFSSVFTEFHLFEKIVNSMGEDVSSQAINQWLSHLQLSEKVKMQENIILNKQLSQGQKKRLGLMLAALENKKMLILDEWAADQDPHFRRVFYEELIPILKNQGITIFAISHDDKYFHHADRIISMKQGTLSEHSAKQAFDILNKKD